MSRRLLLVPILAACLCGGILHTFPAFAQTPGANPVVPELNTPIPTLEFIPDAGKDDSSLFAQYVAGAYRYLITIAATIATIMFVWGAFLYLVGTALPSIQRGEEIMKDAVVGLLLVLGAHLILRTVNPATLSLQALYIKGVEPIPYDDTEYLPRSQEGQTAQMPSGGSITLPKAICRGSECAAYCNGCSVKLPLPPTPWIPAPSTLTPVVLGNGLVSGNPKKKMTFLMRPDSGAALANAGKIASDQGYTLRIGETYRPLEGQLAGVCANICGRSKKQLAPPGASLHGTGIAVDLSLFQGNKGLVYPVFPLSEQEKTFKRQDVETLQRIMTQAGFVRYCPEVWHFEYGRAEGGEMRSSCPWPPPAPRR